MTFLISTQKLPILDKRKVVSMMGNNFIRAAFVIYVSSVSLADAAVVLEIVGGGSSFEESSKVTLKCNVPAFILGTTSLNWEVDSVTYADCILGCASYPPFPGNYSFTFDTGNGDFFLEIDPLQISDDGRIFKCESGTSSSTLSFTVTKASGDGGTTGDGFPPEAIAGIAIGCVVVIPFIIFIVVRCIYKPKIIKIEPTDSTITITWSGQSKQQMFYLSYKETSTTADWNSEGPISYPEKEITHTVDNLTPATSYEVNLYSKCCILKSKKAVCTTKTEGIPYFITVVTHDTSHELTADPTLVLHHAERKEEAKQLLSKEKLKKEMFSYYSFHVELQQMLSPLSILEIELRNMSEDPSFFCEHVIVYCPNTGTYQDFRCHEWLDSRKRLIISDKKPEKKGRSWNEYLQLIANMRLKGVEKGTISYFITVVTDGDSVEIKADPIIVLHHAEKRDETRKSFSKNKLKQGKFNYHSFHIELQKNLSPLSSVEIELIDSVTGLSFICKNVVVYCPDTGLYQDFPCHKPLVSRITLVKNQLKEEKKGSSWKEYLKHIAEMDLSSDEDEL